MHDSYKVPLAIGVVLTVILTVGLSAHEMPARDAAFASKGEKAKVRIEAQFQVGGNVFTVVSESDDADSAAANVYQAGQRLSREHEAKVVRAE